MAILLISCSFVIYLGAFCAIIIIVLLCHYNLWRPRKNPKWPRILMYHSTSDEEPASGMNIKPETFKKQIKYLISKHYTFLKISELPDFHPISNHVVLTFDDGFVSNYTYIFPILKKYKIPATIYLSPNLQGVTYLNEDQIKDMQESELIEFGAHTMNHINLTKVDDETAMKEIAESKKTVEEITGAPCLSFSYPYGRFESRHMKMVEETGFSTAVTTKKQIVAFKDSHPLALPRLSVSGQIDSTQFYLLITRGRFKL